MIARRLLVAVALFGLSATALAQDNPAVKPLNRDIPRHKQFLKVVEKGEGD